MVAYANSTNVVSIDSHQSGEKAFKSRGDEHLPQPEGFNIDEWIRQSQEEHDKALE